MAWLETVLWFNHSPLEGDSQKPSRSPVLSLHAMRLSRCRRADGTGDC